MMSVAAFPPNDLCGLCVSVVNTADPASALRQAQGKQSLGLAGEISRQDLATFGRNDWLPIGGLEESLGL